MGPTDPAALTAATLLATNALPALGGQAGEPTWAGMSRLAALVRDRVRGHHDAEATLAQVGQHPEDVGRIRELGELLAAFAAQDAAFHRDLTALVDQARGDPVVGQLATRVYGQAQVGQILTVGQARDIYIQQPPPPATPMPAGPVQPTEVRWPAPGRIISNLPPRNPVFTGRAELLGQLHETLHPGQVAAVVQVQAQALHGLGGVGKTQLALEYTHAHAADYDLVWWVTAEQPAAIPGQLVALARRLGIPEATQQAETVAVLYDELRGRDRWLLVFDNAVDPADLRRWWPPDSGRVLVTSRNPAWGGLAATVPLDVLPRGEAVGLLRRRLKRDDPAFDALAEALGDLPLALEQAAAYLEQTHTPPGEYLELLATRARELFALGRPASSDQTIATTWTVSLDRLRADAPAAGDLLRLCAFLAPDDIPRELLQNYPDALPEPLAGAVRDRLGYQQALGALGRYSLATVTHEAISVHRLVQAVVRQSLPPDAQRRRAGAAVRLVLAAFPDDGDEVRAWPRYARLLPHALAATGHASSVAADPDATARLLNQAGRYPWGRVELWQRRQLLERALAIRQARLGPDHLDVAQSLNDLGRVLRELGELPAARDAHRRALAIREARLGPDHLDVADSVANLAVVAGNLGEWSAARAAHERALAVREARLGPGHPLVAQSLSPLGNVLRELGDLPAARKALERAVAIREAQHGPDDPRVANSLATLGFVLHDLGELPAARDAHQRALAIRQTRLGPGHRDTAYSLTNLGAVLRELGDLEHARPLLEQAVAIFEARLGPDNPDVAMGLDNLGLLLADLGELAAARDASARALSICQARMGADHPDTARSLSNLAGALRAQGDFRGARHLLERALAVREARLGADHPTTAHSLSNLALVLRDQGDLRGARALLERALTIFEARLGADHPDAVRSRQDLAAVVAVLDEQS
ncbi:MAG TPA: FxSxx-COOH system tetratricopeptide repeat protein [Actinomycetota bacterium]|jgi:tetratricopeptide (TPR) repeat protein